MQTTVIKITAILSLAVACGAVVFALQKVNTVRNSSSSTNRPLQPTYTPTVVTSMSYDWATARSRLERVGLAIQAYRQTQTVLPVSQRKGPADCGLPMRYAVFSETGKPWSIDPIDLRAPSTVPMPPSAPRPGLTDFTFFYRNSKLVEPPMQSLWSSRGEDMIIIVDTNAYTPQQIASGSTSNAVPILVLRLNGRVDLVVAKLGDMGELFAQ